MDSRFHGNDTGAGSRVGARDDNTGILDSRFHGNDTNTGFRLGSRNDNAKVGFLLNEIPDQVQDDNATRS